MNAGVVPHYIMDLRNTEQVERRPPPEYLKRANGGFLNVTSTPHRIQYMAEIILASDIRKVFGKRMSGDYHSRFPTLRFPRKEDLIVCVADEARDCRKAVQELEALGFDW